MTEYGIDPLTDDPLQDMGPYGTGYRVVSKHSVKSMELSRNGNDPDSKVSRKSATNIIGTGLSRQEAQRIADEFNQKDGFMKKLGIRAKVILDEPPASH